MWNLESFIGIGLTFGFCFLWIYLAIWRIDEQLILETMIRMNGREPFPNAAKIMNYLFKTGAIILVVLILIMIIVIVFSILESF